ncbi:MAG: hypothetical protein LUD40_08020 [Phocaeicola dorei]|nr:hypothetical protein [Phocaeicola dorei]
MSITGALIYANVVPANRSDNVNVEVLSQVRYWELKGSLSDGRSEQ